MQNALVKLEHALIARDTQASWMGPLISPFALMRQYGWFAVAPLIYPSRTHSLFVVARVARVLGLAESTLHLPCCGSDFFLVSGRVGNGGWVDGWTN